MDIIINGFALLIPYIFMICVVGIIWNKVFSAFTGRFK